MKGICVCILNLKVVFVHFGVYKTALYLHLFIWVRFFLGLILISASIHMHFMVIYVIVLSSLWFYQTILYLRLSPCSHSYAYLSGRLCLCSSCVSVCPYPYLLCHIILRSNVIMFLCNGVTQGDLNLHVASKLATSFNNMQNYWVRVDPVLEMYEVVHLSETVDINLKYNISLFWQIRILK
jgi:hypothetical protein